MIDPASISMQKDYVEQRASGAYLVSTCQPEEAYDLSVVAKNKTPSITAVEALNKRLKWQIEIKENGLKFIPIELSSAKLFVFVDGSFANKKDYSSHIGYVIILANEYSELG